MPKSNRPRRGSTSSRGKRFRRRSSRRRVSRRASRRLRRRSPPRRRVYRASQKLNVRTIGDPEENVVFNRDIYTVTSYETEGTEEELKKIFVERPLDTPCRPAKTEKMMYNPVKHFVKLSDDDGKECFLSQKEWDFLKSREREHPGTSIVLESFLKEIMSRKSLEVSADSTMVYFTGTELDTITEDGTRSIIRPWSYLWPVARAYNEGRESETETIPAEVSTPFKMLENTYYVDPKTYKISRKPQGDGVPDDEPEVYFSTKPIIGYFTGGKRFAVTPHSLNKELVNAYDIERQRGSIPDGMNVEFSLLGKTYRVRAWGEIQDTSNM